MDVVCTDLTPSTLLSHNITPPYMFRQHPKRVMIIKLLVITWTCAVATHVQTGGGMNSTGASIEYTGGEYEMSCAVVPRQDPNNRQTASGTSAGGRGGSAGTKTDDY